MLRWLLYGVMIVVAWQILHRLAPVLTPVMVAFAIAYMLDPAVEKLVARGMSRTVAATLLLLGFLGIVVGLCILIIPQLIHQVRVLIADAPQWLERVKQHEILGQDMGKLLAGLDIRAMLESAIGPPQGVAFSALSILGHMAEALLIPVFAYYFLLDWPNVTGRIRRLIPPRRRGLVLEILGQIDGVVSGWVRGQLIVTTTLAVLYAVAFTALGVDYGVPLGLLVGGLTIIPFVGTFVGAGIMAVMFGLHWPGTTQVAGVGIAFVVLHLLEAAVLTPKIVGHKVGLSESAALFAVLAGGKLLGFVGILLAVPLAATVAVLLRHVARTYEKSDFFGHEDDAIVPVTGAMALLMVNEQAPGTRTVPTATVVDPAGADDKPDDDPVT